MKVASLAFVILVAGVGPAMSRTATTPGRPVPPDGVGCMHKRAGGAARMQLAMSGQRRCSASARAALAQHPSGWSAATGELRANSKSGGLREGAAWTAGLADGHTQIDSAVAGGAAVSSSKEEGGTPQVLEEVIVTAQKAEERLIEVPVAVTAISGSALVDNNQVRLQDYFSTIPGLSFTTDANGAPILAIRGLTTGQNNGNPTTSVTIDGIPFGSSSSYGGTFALLPDVDPSDLARVEVLRGPQGTLYGAASLGGLINYVTVEPSTDGFSGRVESELGAVKGGSEAEFAVRGAANIPISTAAALRVSGFARRTPGFIDNVLTGQSGTNRVDAEGGHTSLLVRPSDSWSFELSALYQNNNGYGLDYADPGLGDLKQANIPRTGKYHSEVQAYSAKFTAKVGAGEVTSLSGYNVNSMHDVEDVSNFYGFFAQQDFGVAGVEQPDWQRTSKFTQEVRLAMPITSSVDWLLGVFYTHEKARVHQQYWAEDIASGAVLDNGNMLDGTWPTTYTEYAAFTDITVHFTSRFDVQIGGRESEDRQTYSEVDGGGYTTVFGLPGAPAPLVTPEVDTKDNAFTYLVTPRYKITPNTMVYARVATGFRPGGPNPTCSAFDLPCHFDPDRTQDYELGIKGDLMGHTLDFDAAVFYIDWKHIQLSSVPACECALVFINAGGAKSQGVELSAQSKPTANLTLSGWVDWTEAVLTAGLPPTSVAVGSPGDRLPFSPRVSGSVTAEEEFPISEEASLFMSGQVSYQGNRFANFSFTTQRPYYPAYAEVNLRGGIYVHDWRFALFANNIADRRGILGGSLPVPFGGNGYTYIQPRTVGVSVAKTF